MYIPSSNEMTDHQEQISFMTRYNFATLITNVAGVPTASHLPMVIVTQGHGERVVIQGHFAKNNDQRQHIVEQENLVIFSQPHAYISPKFYDAKLSVPTWNYLAVHAYGKGQIISELSDVEKHLDALALQHDPDYKAKWDQYPQDYKTNLAKGIVVFEILVDRVEGKKKLSQNKSNIEKEKIISGLEASADVNERDVAEYMSATKS